MEWPGEELAVKSEFSAAPMVSSPCIMRLISEVSGLSPKDSESTSICSTASKHSGG